jgi:hypothetical protein
MDITPRNLTVYRGMHISFVVVLCHKYSGVRLSDLNGTIGWSDNTED